MGAPMAQNLLSAGARLVVFNRTAAKCAPLVALGARAAVSPREVAEQTGAGTIVLCVSDTPALTAALTGSEGVLCELAPDTLVIDMGTSEVGKTKQLASSVRQAGGHYVDAPVSGGEVGARDGSLSIMAGGNDDDIARARPLLSVLGKSLTHIGPVGTGQAAKAANQAIVGAAVSIIAESLILAQAAGADIKQVREALLGGFAGSRVLDLHGQRMIDEAFDPGARAATQLKDMTQAAKLANELNLTLPLISKCRDLWAGMVDAGYGEYDQSGYFEYVRSDQNSLAIKGKSRVIIPENQDQAAAETGPK